MNLLYLVLPLGIQQGELMLQEFLRRESVIAVSGSVNINTKIVTSLQRLIVYTFSFKAYSWIREVRQRMVKHHAVMPDSSLATHFENLRDRFLSDRQKIREKSLIFIGFSSLPPL